MNHPSRSHAEEEHPLHRTWPRRLRATRIRCSPYVPLIAATGLTLVLWTVYAIQPDQLAAATFSPAWCWSLVILFLFVLGIRKKTRWLSLGAILLWLGFSLTSIDELPAFLFYRDWPTQQWQNAASRNEAIRVVSLNCYEGRRRCALEVADYSPDIVLYQEAPSRDDLQAVTEELYGESGQMVWTPDTAIVSRFPLEICYIEPLYRFVHASARLPGDRQLHVFSVRFTPPSVRFDLWNPNCWRDHLNIRKKHRSEVSLLMQQLRKVPADIPLLAGGDFNMPAGDGSLEPLNFRLRDAYRTAGVGWGDTVLNHAPVIEGPLPVMRFDQLWNSKGLRASAVVARTTQHSDHRMVIGDWLIE